MESPKFVVELAPAFCVCTPVEDVPVEPEPLSGVPACEPPPEAPVLPVDPVLPMGPVEPTEPELVADPVLPVEPVLAVAPELEEPEFVADEPDEGADAADTGGMIRMPEPQPVSIASTHTTIIEGRRCLIDTVAKDLP
jgi:hypothetical protein